MKFTPMPVDRAKLKKEQSDAIARAKEQQAKAEAKAAEAKSHLAEVKALTAGSEKNASYWAKLAAGKAAEAKAHLEAAKALQAEANAKPTRPTKLIKPSQPTKPAAVKKAKTIEFKESKVMMPVPGNLGIVAVHGMKMKPSEGGVPSMEVQLRRCPLCDR